MGFIDFWMNEFDLFQLEGCPTPIKCQSNNMWGFILGKSVIDNLDYTPQVASICFAKSLASFVSNITQKVRFVKTSEATATRIAILCIAIQRYKLIRRFETLPTKNGEDGGSDDFLFCLESSPTRIGILEHGISMCFFSIGFWRMLKGWNANGFLFRWPYPVYTMSITKGFDLFWKGHVGEWLILFGNLYKTGSDLRIQDEDGAFY